MSNMHFVFYLDEHSRINLETLQAKIPPLLRTDETMLRCAADESPAVSIKNEAEDRQFSMFQVGNNGCIRIFAQVTFVFFSRRGHAVPFNPLR